MIRLFCWSWWGRGTLWNIFGGLSVVASGGKELEHLASCDYEYLAGDLKFFYSPLCKISYSAHICSTDSLRISHIFNTVIPQKSLGRHLQDHQSRGTSSLQMSFSPHSNLELSWQDVEANGGVNCNPGT